MIKIGDRDLSFYEPGKAEKRAAELPGHESQQPFQPRARLRS
jgi:hypothetical protein